MKLVLEAAENGFIVEEDPETMVGGIRTIGKKHVFAEVEDVQEFITNFYAKQGKRTKRPKKVEESP